MVDMVDRVMAAVAQAAAPGREALAVLATAPGLAQVLAPVAPDSAREAALRAELAERAVVHSIPAMSRRNRPESVYAKDIKTMDRLEALPAFWRGRALARRMEAELIGAGHAADVHLNKAKEYEAIADRLAKWQ